MGVRWTHLTLPVGALDASVGFVSRYGGLAVIRDRRLEGGRTVWLGPPRDGRSDPQFVLVLAQAEVKTPVDHLGFQCNSRSEVDAVATLARDAGILVDGPRDAGGSIGYHLLVREPSGHLVEFTFGQPILGLGGRRSGSAVSV
jgi:lactoylglutathione lyase